MKKQPSKIKLLRKAFSLVEVVVAVGVFGIAVVALLGVLTATGKTVGDLSDSDAAAKLAANVESEMRRYASIQTDFNAFASGIPASGAASLELYATKDGGRVVVESAADNNLDGAAPTLPTGISGRDRYFCVKVNRMPAPLNYTNGNGFVALSVVVEWPYQLPLGPEPSSPSLGTEGSDYSVTEIEDRSSYLLNLAITP